MSIQAKLKQCAGCQQLKYIWKSHGKEKFCKECWYKQEPPKKAAPVSKKMKETISAYTKLRDAFLYIKTNCEAKLVGCTGKATDVHHKAGRNENHLKVGTWLAVCRSCHRWIEDNPLEAKELGLSESRLKNEEND